MIEPLSVSDRVIDGLAARSGQLVTAEKMESMKESALIIGVTLRHRMTTLDLFTSDKSAQARKGDHPLVQLVVEAAHHYMHVRDRMAKTMARIERLPKPGPADSEAMVDRKIKNNEILLETARELGKLDGKSVGYIDLLRKIINDVEGVISKTYLSLETTKANEDRIKIAQIKKGHGKPGNALELTAQMNQNADNKAAAFSEARTVEQAPEPTPAEAVEAGVVEAQIETAPLASRSDPHGPIQWPKPRIVDKGLP